MQENLPEISENMEDDADEDYEASEVSVSIDEILATDNIASILSKNKLVSIGSDCKRGLEIDMESRSEWLKLNAEAMDLALQVSKEKDTPWPKAANMVYPIITVAAIQFAARAYPAVVPGKEIVKGAVYGYDGGVPVPASDGNPAVNPQTGETLWKVKPGEKAAQADRISRHMSWQLLEEDEDWESDTDAMLHYLPIAGVAFRKRYVDQETSTMLSKWLPATELVVNNSAPSLDKAPRISEMVNLYPSEIRKRMNTGVWIDYDIDVLRNNDIDDAQEESSAGDPEPDDDDALIPFVEQHCLIDIDDDGYPEPYIVTFSRAGGHVVSIVRAFDVDDVHSDDDDAVLYIDRQISYIKYDFIPHPKGEFYSLGFGWLLGNLNRGINTTINQMLDSGALANRPMGWIAKGLRMRGGTRDFKPGEFKMVDAPGRTLAENIYQMRIEGPSGVLFNLLGTMIAAAKEIASISDIMTGKVDANLAPGTAMILAEQGAKQFSAIFKRFHRSIKKELKLLFHQNALYMPQTVYFNLLGTGEAVVKEDYASDEIGISPLSDPQMASSTLRMAKAQFILSSMQQGAAINRAKGTARALDAAGIPDYAELIEEPGPDPKTEINKMRAETDRVRAMAAADHIEAEIAELKTRAEKNLAEAEGEIAKAEAQEAGQQIDVYFRHLQELREAINLARSQDENAKRQQQQAPPGQQGRV